MIYEEGGYWISPSGEIIRVHDHFAYIREHPEQFGFQPDDPRLTGRRTSGDFPNLKKFRDEIIIEAIRRNWIRVRLLPNASDHVNVRKLDRRTTGRLFDFYSRFPAGYNSKMTVFTELASGAQFENTPKEIVMQNPVPKRSRIFPSPRRERVFVEGGEEYVSVPAPVQRLEKKYGSRPIFVHFVNKRGKNETRWFHKESLRAAKAFAKKMKRESGYESVITYGWNGQPIRNNPCSGKRKRKARRNPSSPVRLSNKTVAAFRRIHGTDPDQVQKIPGKHDLIVLGEVTHIEYIIPFNSMRSGKSTRWRHKFHKKPLLVLTSDGKPDIIFTGRHKITSRGLIG